MIKVAVTAFVALSALSLASCFNMFQEQTGILRISFSNSATLATRTIDGLPDTEDFILSVTDADGKTIYEGRFGDSPEEFSVSPGSYTVTAVSCLFTEPEYDAPQFGDCQVVVVNSDETVSVRLECSQQNCGLKINVAESFRETFPEGWLYLESNDGILMHNYSESRTAYFNPGKVVVSVCEDGMNQTLFTRTLQAAQMLSVNLSSNIYSNSGGIEILVDTTRTHIAEDFIYGYEEATTAENPLGIMEARERAGAEDVWVCGYIVGCATSTSKYSFEEPFTKETNLLLGLRATTDNPDYCLSVELKSGSIREALNLVDNPDVLGRQICMKGDLVSAYYGIPGLKNVTEYQFR